MGNPGMKILCAILKYLPLGFLPVLVLGCGVAMPKDYGSGIAPIYPPMSSDYDNPYKTIGTLTPELKWKDTKKAGETYDLCIWETPYRSADDVIAKSKQQATSWGTVVYTANNLPVNSHQVAIALKPATYYNWSVRLRNGDNVGPWSYYVQNEMVFAGIANVTKSRSNCPFGFKTTDQ